MTPKDIQSADALGNITIAQPTKVVPISELEHAVTAAQQQVASAESEVNHLAGRLAAANDALTETQADYDAKKAVFDAATSVAVAAGFASAQADTL